MATKQLTYLAGGPDGKIIAKTSTRAVSEVEVVVKVTHSGVCGTDSHDRVSGCGLGHEGVGIVEEVGKNVTIVKVGQRVGWGWHNIACGHCSDCSSDFRQYCSEARGQKYSELEQGAFGDYVIRHQDFVYPIPDELESKHAAPLNCAGLTVYEALLAANTKPTDRVGVIGLGGLGHIGVMYARAMGCEVTVFSGSEDKRADAMALGATEFHLFSKEGKTGDAKMSKINVLLIVGPVLKSFEPILPLLAPRARILPLVIQIEPLVVPYLQFIIPGYQIIASTSGARQKASDVLEFAAKHKIKPWVQEFPMSVDGLSQALTALDNGSIRYRAVLSTGFAGSKLT